MQPIKKKCVLRANKNVRPPFKEPNENGFELGSVSGPLEILDKSKIDKLLRGKKTAKFHTNSIKLTSKLLYPYYEDPNDNKTLKYCVRWCKKKTN
jgi:hypothetical protein